MATSPFEFALPIAVVKQYLFWVKIYVHFEASKTFKHFPHAVSLNI